MNEGPVRTNTDRDARETLTAPPARVVPEADGTAVHTLVRAQAARRTVRLKEIA